MAFHKIIENRADLKSWLRYEKGKYTKVTPLYFLGLLTEQDAIWKYQRRLRITE